MTTTGIDECVSLFAVGGWSEVKYGFDTRIRERTVIVGECVDDNFNDFTRLQRGDNGSSARGETAPYMGFTNEQSQFKTSMGFRQGQLTVNGKGLQQQPTIAGPDSVSQEIGDSGQSPGWIEKNRDRSTERNSDPDNRSD